MANQNVKQNAGMAGEKASGVSRAGGGRWQWRLTAWQPCRPVARPRPRAFRKAEFDGKDYVSAPPSSPRLSSETARDISPKQAAVAISDDQNATHSRAGMTFSSSAGWVT